MADYADLGGGNGNGGGNADPVQLAAWINGAKSRVASGQPLDRSGQWDPAHGKFGLPLGYAVNNGQLELDANTWGAIWPGLLGTAGMATLGLLIGPALVGGAPATSTAAGGGAGTTGSTVPNIGALVPAQTGADIAAMTAPSAGTPSWLLPAIRAAVPLATTVASHSGLPSGSSANGLNSEQNDLLTQLIRMSTTRQEESAPVHQAAMKLALGLAPSGSWGDSPRFQDAVQSTGGPGPASTMHPQIADAVARLMKGGA